MSEFEEAFPISAHWIEWSPSKNRYDCHVGLADSKCSEYNNMFKVWLYQQAKIKLLEKEITETQAFFNNQNHIKQAEVDHFKTMNRRYIGKMQEQQDQIAELKNQLACCREENKALLAANNSIDRECNHISSKYSGGEMTLKHDQSKPRASLLPKGAVNAVIRVLEFGAKKYDPDNWKTVPDAKTRYYDAMQRHIDAWWNGEQKDAETGEHHLAHAICCGMFLWWFDDMDTKVMAGQGLAAKFVRKGDLPERGPIDQLGYQIDQSIPQAILDAQVLRGEHE